MADLFLLSEAQMRRIERYFPLSHGIARVDDSRIVSAIVFVIRNGLRWRDAPREYGPHKTIYNRFVRWSRLGVFNRIFAELGAQGRQTGADHDRRHASEGASHRGELFKKGPVPRRIGRTKGGLNSKLHAVGDGDGRPLVMLLSEGQMSDYKGAALMLPALPKAKQLLADKGYDADWFRAASAREASPPAFLRKPTGKPRSCMTSCSTNSAIRSKTCSGASKTGGASTPDTTVAPTPTCRQSA